MSSMLYEWQTIGHKYRLCRWGTRLEGWRELEAFDAKWALRIHLAQPGASRAVAGAIVGNVSGTLRRDLDDQGILERELEQRRFVILEQPRASMHLGHAPTAKLSEGPPRENGHPCARAWIEVTVFDDSVTNEALAGTRFRLSLPDRSIHEGVLDHHGHVRLDDIEPGQCWFELTE